MKRKVFKLAEKLGSGKALVQLYVEKASGMREIPVDSNIGELSVGDKKGKILMVIENTPNQAYIAGILATKFRLKGYETVLLSHKDFSKSYSGPVEKHDDEVRKKIKEYKLEMILSKFNLEMDSIYSFLPSDYTVPKLDRIPEEYSDFNVDKAARATSRKRFRRHTLDIGEGGEHREAYNNFLKTSAIIADGMEEIIEKSDIGAVMVVDPVYLNRIYGEAGKKHEIPSYSFDVGYLGSKLIFGSFYNRTPQMQFTDPKTVEKELEKELKDEERREIKRIMEDRADGDAVQGDAIEKAENSVKTDSRKTIGAFTNLMWDGSLETEDNLFSSPFTWIKETVNKVRDIEDVKLIIKTHPAESFRKTNEKVTDWIDENIENLPENVRILEPDTNVSPYEMMRDIDQGIVWNSTIGMEMAYNAVPVTVVGDTHYKGFNFTQDPKTKSEYFDSLRDEASDMNEEQIERARKYCHFLFCQKHWNFNFIERKKGIMGFKQVSLDNIQKSKTLENITTKILENKPVIRDQ